MSQNSRRSRKGAARERHISVRAVRRDPPDLRKLSRALITLAMAQAAAEAQAEAEETARRMSRADHAPEDRTSESGDAT
jgi:hypothetical protein